MTDATDDKHVNESTYFDNTLPRDTFKGRDPDTNRGWFGMEKQSSFWKVVLNPGKYKTLELFYSYERIVAEALNKPLPASLISAIRDSGCPFDYRRHVSVEKCTKKVLGGYDPIHKQIIVCKPLLWQNDEKLRKTLVHSLTQMFDHCRMETDFKPLDHLSCSMIRAYNFTVCRSVWDSNARSGEKLQHQNCIRRAATEEIRILRPTATEDAIAESINRVFEKCYNDREPLGKIPLFESKDPEIVWNYTRHKYNCI